MAATSSIQHLKKLQSLLEGLAEDDIRLLRYEYIPESFGNFTMILAKGAAKVRFLWDARESLLTIECLKEQHESVGEVWEHDATIEVDSPEVVFAEIGSNAAAVLQ